MLNQQIISTPADMENAYAELCQGMLMSHQRDRGRVHAQENNQLMFELNHMTLVWDISTSIDEWQNVVKPNLPWAEDHFQERISGEPLNPPPSASWWPYNQNDNEVHKKGDQFSHTYPERFWPRRANGGDTDGMMTSDHWGIRYRYGDLVDLLNIVTNDPWTRQAYLPVWFPEDLAAAVHGERVPCTLGYHFLQTETGILDCTYSLRSCDIVRFFRDDIYMAGRLAHYVCTYTNMIPGRLVVHISNLHAFEGDRYFLEQTVRPKQSTSLDPRAHYNFDALG